MIYWIVIFDDGHAERVETELTIMDASVKACMQNPFYNLSHVIKAYRSGGKHEGENPSCVH